MAVQQQEWIFSSEPHTPKFSNTAAPCRGHPWPEPPGQGTQCKLTEALQQHSHFFFSNKLWVAFYPHRKMSSRILFKYKANKKSKPPMQRSSLGQCGELCPDTAGTGTQEPSQRKHTDKSNILASLIYLRILQKKKKKQNKNQNTTTKN